MENLDDVTVADGYIGYFREITANFDLAVAEAAGPALE